MADSGISPSLGRRIAARVEEMVDTAADDAAEMAARAEDDRRALLSDAHDRACKAFEHAAAGARAAAGERVERLAALRLTIAERSEVLVAEADDPELVRQQVESLLVALAETEAAIGREVAIGRQPEPPADPEPAPAAAPAPEAEPAAAVETAAEPPENGNGADPFTRWQRNRFSGQLLAVMRMAVGGMSRSELEDQLDPALSSGEREALLDDVFGRPGSRGARVLHSGDASRASRPALG